MASSLIQPIAPSLINSITGKGQEGGFLPLLALLLMMKVLEKGVRSAGRGYMKKKFSSFLAVLSLNNIEITNYFDYEPEFNSVFSRNNLPRIKAYVINLDYKNSKGTLWVSLFIDKNTVVYSDSFRIECIPQEILNKIKDKSITYNIFIIQDNESIMCGFYCITFIEHMLSGKIY